MILSKACTEILEQLTDIIQQLRDQDFTKPSVTLGQSTVGQHLRHTLEFFLCLEQSYHKGRVNYDNRNHDKSMEADKGIALQVIHRIREFINAHPENQTLTLEVGYERHNENAISLESNFYRELAYNIEHAVHHMALMKIGLREVAPYVIIPPDFGIAVSTLRYREMEEASR